MIARLKMTKILEEDASPRWTWGLGLGLGGLERSRPSPPPPAVGLIPKFRGAVESVYYNSIAVVLYVH